MNATPCRSRYRKASSIAAAADKIIEPKQSETLDAALRLPGVSNGLPPPLWSLRDVCESAAADVVVVPAAGDCAGVVCSVVAVFLEVVWTDVDDDEGDDV